MVASFVGFRYWRDATLYITTDDALIDTTLQTITSPGAGTLVTWQAQTGAHVTANEIIGIVRAMPGLANVSSYNVTAPIDGTLLRVEAHVGQNVSPALPLAYVADLDHLRVTAYIDETEIRAVRIGKPVEITVDATGGTLYQGTVSEIIPATAGQFALLPSSDRSTGNAETRFQVPGLPLVGGHEGRPYIPLPAHRRHRDLRRAVGFAVAPGTTAGEFSA